METSNAPTRSILDYVQAKRQQYDQRLDALQLLSSVSQHNTNNTNNGSVNGSACNASCPVDCNESLHRVDSSEWLENFGAFVPLLETNSAAPTPVATSKYHSYSHNNNSNSKAVSLNGHGNYTYAPQNNTNWRQQQGQQQHNNNSHYDNNNNNDATAASLSSFAQELRGMAAAQQHQQQQQQQQGPRRVSNNELYVVSDRLASILPDFDMSQEATSSFEDGNSNATQLFQDSDAWLMSALSSSTGAAAAAAPSMPPLSAPPALVRSISNSDSSRSSNSLNQTKKQKKKAVTKKSRSSSNLGAASKTQQRKLGRPSAFPQKLHRMLTELYETRATNTLCQVVGFTADGSAFSIYDNEAFVTEVLPKYFNMSSFSSFQRQLQLYSFKRQSKGGPYGHPHFHRDASMESVGQMARKQSRPTTTLFGSSSTSSASSPNMSRC